MKSKQQRESRLSYYLDYLGNLVIYNLLWLLCCIPVITIGPATTALFSVQLDLVQGLGASGAKHFFKEFLRTFRRSIQIWFMVILVCVFLVADFIFMMSQFQSYQDILLPVCIALSLFFGFICVYLFPLLSRKKGTIKEIFSLAVRMSVGYFPTTILLFTIAIIPIISFIFFSPMILMSILPFWFFVGFSLLSNISARLLCSKLLQV